MDEVIEQEIFGLGRDMQADAVVVGSCAAWLMLPGFRDPRDINVVVSHDAFAYLRQQPDWKQTSDGFLARNRVRVSTSLGSVGFVGLRDRSWKTKSGVQVAGLPDIYAYKHRRATSLDLQDMTYIRTYLQGERNVPLAAQFIPHEVAAIRLCLPDELREDPQAEAAILLAANGFHTVYTIYGHPQIGQANHIIGELEQPDFWVPATYHNGFELLSDTKALQRHLANINASSHDRLLALAIDPYTDAIYGNGRFRNNPDGYDELRAASLLRTRARQLGFADTDAQRMYTVTLATAFDEITRTQRGKYDTDVLARAAVAVDLQSFSEPNWVERGIDIAIEDICSARHNKARTLGKVLAEHGERVYSTAEALALVDRYADAKPADAPDGPTVIESFAHRLIENASFQRTYEYPYDWTSNNPRLRELHAQTIETLGVRLLAREITAVEAGWLAAEHTAAIHNKTPIPARATPGYAIMAP